MGTRGDARSERCGDQRGCQVREAWGPEWVPGQRGMGTRGAAQLERYGD